MPSPLLKYAQMLVLGVTLLRICSAVPTGSSSPHHLEVPPSSSASRVNQHHTQHDIIPPTSHYGANKPSSSEQIDAPDWDSFAFHMINDHPTNAKKHREALDQLLKDDLIDPHLHETETHNSKTREQAVTHILNGGMVLDIANNAVIYDKHLVLPDKVEEHRKGGYQARFRSYGVVRRYGLTKQEFHHPPRHDWHHGDQFHQAYIRQDVQDRSAHRRVHIGRQQHIIEVQASSSHIGTSALKKDMPPPSPSSSPSPPSRARSQRKRSRKRARDDPFAKYHAWQ